jgi:autotransporter-associated beta strand protein
MTNLASACIYGNGATINNNGYAITIGQPLLAPTGNGVYSIAGFSGGTGYIAPPIVTVNRGSGDTSGVGATAIAQINPATGVVTNVVITCPGANYTAVPTFTVTGGGASRAAVIIGATPTANASGGLTTTGSGTLTLSSPATYGGSTTVSNGTLKLYSAPASVPPTAPVLYLSFNEVAGKTVTNQGSGGTAMNGTLTGSASIVSGGINGGKALNIPSGAATAAYVLVNSPVVAMTGAASWTIGVWVKTTTPGGVYAYQGSGGWASGNMTFYLNEGSDAGTGTKAGGVSYSQGWEEGSTSVNDGNWHFLVMSCNGHSKSMYVDGKTDTIVSSWASGTGVGTQLWIGGSADTGDEDVGLGGLIGGAYVYNYALTQAQIQWLYSSNGQVLPTNTAVTVASGATLDVGGISQTIGSLTGPAGGKVILADSNNATGTLTVGNATSTVFAGTISAAGTLAKAGAGTLTLTGTNTYSGGTVISNGTLVVNNSSGSGTGSGAVTVASGGTLAGTGIISGAVTVNSGGSFAPGNPLGTLTINSNLTLAAGSTTLMQVGHSPLTNNAAEITGTLSLGGTLTVTNIGGPLQGGDTFTLFNGGTYANAFSVTNLPSLAPGLVWNTANLNNGVLSVVSTGPVNITASSSGGAMNLSWPADHLGWQLQMQSNAVGMGLGTNWTDVTGATGTNAVQLMIDPSGGNVFFRLVYP